MEILSLYCRRRSGLASSHRSLKPEIIQTMSYTREQGIEFWYAFDEAFLNRPTQEVRRLYTEIRGPGTVLTWWRQSRSAGTYPASFADAARAVFPAFLRLAELQFEVMQQHFPDDMDSLRLAFEDFGQGVLFDDRRLPTNKIHKMDIGGPLVPPVGYHRWHANIRAAVLAGADISRWLELNRFVGLAWAIQSIAKPVEDAPDNPALPASTLEGLRDIWLGMNADELDSAFDSVPYPPPELLPDE